jgi:hypothetical protein
MPAARTAFVLALASAALAAQEPGDALERRLAEMQSRYEARIAALEGEVRSLKDGASARADSDRAAVVDERIRELEANGSLARALDQQTRFDNRFNPAIGVVGDFVAVVSDQNDSFEFSNQFVSRGAELDVNGRIDPFGYYSLVVHFLPDEVEFEEGYAVIDQGLPDTFTLKAGKFFYDFGKLGPQHDHELPFVDKPAVYQEFFGGSPTGVGLELHHWFSVGETPVRWSLGAVNSAEGDTVAILGPSAGHEHEDDAGGEPFGRRGFENLAYHARVTSVLDLGAESSLQIGLSALYAPEQVSFTDDGLGGVLRDETAKRTYGLDVTYRWRDPSRDDGFTMGLEILHNRQKFLAIDDTVSPIATSVSPSVTAWGGYAYAEYEFNRRWSAGGFLDLVDRIEADGFNWISGGAFVTWRINHFHRLRLQVQAIDDELSDDRYFAAMLQWTVIIGSHAHPLDF